MIHMLIEEKMERQRRNQMEKMEHTVLEDEK